MKPIATLLFFLFIGCKSETKTEAKSEEAIDTTVYALWNNYTTSNPEFATDEMPESWYFHDNKEDADRLAELTRRGKKRAGSGLYSWYKEAHADIPKIGTKHIITDFEGKARAIIEIKMVDTIPFNQISKAYAEMDMGTDNEVLKKWKKAHWDFFANAMEESGEKPTEEMLIVCERFETIWTEK